MLTSFVLSLTLAAPVPAAPSAPVASGPLPRLMEVKANADGKVMVPVSRPEKVKVQAGVAVAPGGNAPPPVVREVTVTKRATVELSEVKELTITTADGKKVELEDALKTLKGGAVVVVSADGKPVSPAHLKLFKDNVLVLASPELAGPQGAQTAPGRPGVIRPLPAPVQPQVLPALPPGGIQIQPGVIQLVPAVPPQAKPAPAPQK